MEKAKATATASTSTEEQKVESTQHDLAETTKQEVSTYVETPMGFEDEDPSDIIIPRVKVIQTLSPEKKDKIADEGDILNSLTKERLNGKVFIPVFKFANNIDWIPRSEGGGIRCIAHDGKIGKKQDGTAIMCAACKRCEFDNTKTGKESLPQCTKYINFFGFFAGERMPIILSFGKTNYGEGKKLYSLAKVTMQNMWNYGYALNEKLMAKNSNEWYIITATVAGASDAADREFALDLFKQFRDSIATMKFDMEEAGAEVASEKIDVEGTEF